MRTHVHWYYLCDVSLQMNFDFNSVKKFIDSNQNRRLLKNILCMSSSLFHAWKLQLVGIYAHVTRNFNENDMKFMLTRNLLSVLHFIVIQVDHLSSIYSFFPSINVWVLVSVFFARKVIEINCFFFLTFSVEDTPVGNN